MKISQRSKIWVVWVSCNQLITRFFLLPLFLMRWRFPSLFGFLWKTGEYKASFCLSWVIQWSKDRKWTRSRAGDMKMNLSQAEVRSLGTSILVYRSSHLCSHIICTENLSKFVLERLHQISYPIRTQFTTHLSLPLSIQTANLAKSAKSFGRIDPLPRAHLTVASITLQHY